MTDSKWGLVAVPLTSTPGDDVKDGSSAVTPDGTVWQHRKGLWYEHPWWQRCDAEEIIAVCDDPEEWAYNLGWTREQVEESVGALTYIHLPAPSSSGQGETTAAAESWPDAPDDPAIQPVSAEDREGE